MRKIARSSVTTILGATFVLLLPAAPAQAAPRTWVSSAGSGAVCSRVAPCATFAAAHTATDPGGEINCVDANDYGPVTITKAISIVCDNTEAGILQTNSLSTAVTINAGATDIVTLKGLDIEGGGTGARGIDFTAGAALHVHKVQIRNFRAPNGRGIGFIPPDYAELYVADSYITDNGVDGGGTNGGIVIQPSATGSVNAFINRVQLENNAVGILVDGSFSTGVAVNAIVLESTVVGSAGHGIAAFTTAGHAAVSVLVDHAVVSGNFASGINANGAAASGAGSAVVRIGDSTIALNLTGVSTTNAGVVQSFKNNRISGNLADGTPITAFPGPGGPLQ